MGAFNENFVRLGLAYQREREALRKQRTERIPSRIMYARDKDVKSESRQAQPEVAHITPAN